MPHTRSLFFLYDTVIDQNSINTICTEIENRFHKSPQCNIFEKRAHNYNSGDLIFIMISDSDFLHLFNEIKDHPITIVIVPYPDNTLQQKEYDIPSNPEDALELVSNENSFIRTNVITCNDKTVIGSIKIGEADWSESYKTVKNIFSHHLKPIHIETDKGQDIDTISLFIEIASEPFMQYSRSSFFKASNNQCRRISSIFYAPQSILGVLKLRFFLSKAHHTSENLPSAIGTIQTDRLHIETAADPFFVSYNDTQIQTKTLEIKSSTTVLGVVSGYKGCVGKDDKESLRMQNLPTDSSLITFFTKKPLPLIPIAAESSFADLFTKLRASAQITPAYMLLLLVSVLMATIGLFQNASPTIIGAMILAPLMAPIISFSMGAIRFDKTLISQSVKTIIFSVLIALTASALLAWMLPFIHITDQMSMRTHPTLLDLAVAILSGVVAAYGYSNSKIGESLAGVAIAVALVPPLCVAGIGIGWASWQIFSDAFLLFLANIAGIVFAAGLIFYLLGYASAKYISTAFFIKFLMLALITVPLWVSSRTLIVDEKIYQEISYIRTIPKIAHRANLDIAKVLHKDGQTLVVINVQTDQTFTTKEKSTLATQVKELMTHNAKLVFNFERVY